MDLGVFTYPGHRPDQPLSAGAEWDLQLIRWAEEFGYKEVWIGEHFTAPWETCPAPDLLIAQALMETERIRLGPGSHSLPFHHPAGLAHRVAYLDHLSKGRLNFGIGASGTPGDLHMFGVDGSSGQNRKMMWESIDAILRLWSDEGPYDWTGDYWTVNKPKPIGEISAFHVRPYQAPHMPIAVTGVSPSSSTLKIAGERGFRPLSIAFSDAYLSGHWETYVAGAEAKNLEPNRSDWGIVREVFVAESDEEAVQLCLEGGVGAFLEGYWLPVLAQVGNLAMYKDDPEMPDSEITVEYVLRNAAWVGSVDTVTEKIEASAEAIGGFGVLLQLGADFSNNPQAMRTSMELLANEVMPRVNRKLAAAA